MNVLALSLDKDALDINSPTVRRMKLYAKELKGNMFFVVHTIGKKYNNLASGKISAYPTNSLNNLFYLRDALKIAGDIIKRENISLIVTQDPHITGLLGVILKKEYKIPLCVHFHADFLDNKYWIKEKRIMYTVFNIISRYVVKRSDSFRVVSSLIRDKLVKRGISPNVIGNISTPLDLKFFYKKDDVAINTFAEKYNLNKKNKHLLFVGRLTEQKNLFFLLDAFKEMYQRDLFLLMVGEGELRDKLKKYVLINNIRNVIFLGKLSPKYTKAAYYFSDIVMLPSLYEGTAKVLKEACACSTPCITTNISGSGDVIENEKTGFITNINKDKFIYLTKKLVNDSKLRTNMGKLANKRIKQEKEEINVKMVTNLWKKTSQLLSQEVD